MKFKNMKIEVNEQQPLDEVVRELEGLGYKATDSFEGNYSYIMAFDNGTYVAWGISPCYAKSTTLAELKEM